MDGTVELNLPDFDLPGTPVTISSWHAQVGQRVVEGERLVEVVAGDVAIDLAAPSSGVLAARFGELDHSVLPGQRLALIQPDD